MYKKILDKITEYKKVIILPHLRPDGDCLGSSFGLKYILETLNIEAHVLGEHARDTEWMGEISTLSDEDFEGSLVVSLDTGSLDRMIDSRANLGDFLIRIDHHPHVEFFGDIDYVDSEKPSTCTIITDMFRELDIKIPKRAAECLFFGTVTDTGRFRHDGVNENTMLNAGHLMNQGVKITDIYDKVYLKDISRLKLDKFVLNNLKMTDFGFLYITLTEDEINEIGLTTEEVGTAISKLENIVDYPVWALFYVISGEVRCRLRSRGIVINELAAKYRGGGHKFASGLTLSSWDELPQFIEDLKIVMKKS